MPHVTTTELSDWVAEFCEDDAARAGSPRAVDTSWDPTLVDTALIVARLGTSGTEAHLLRAIGGSPEWTVTFEARERDAQLSADQVLVLAEEVAAIGRLCAHLTARTTEHLAAAAAQV